METWIQQLLFLAADAAADRNDRLVVRSLDALSTCLIHGNYMEVLLRLRVRMQTHLYGLKGILIIAYEL